MIQVPMQQLRRDGETIELPQINNIAYEGKKSMWISTMTSKFTGQTVIGYLIAWDDVVRFAFEAEEVSYALHLYEDFQGCCPECGGMMFKSNSRHICGLN